MANVQKEKGHTQIANELLEAIFHAELSLREIKIILCIIRYTYGFNRKSAELSIRYFSKATNIKFQHISLIITHLRNKNIIELSNSSNHKQGRIISLNKDYDTWNFDSSQKGDSSQKSDGLVPKKVTVRVPKKVTKKYNNKYNLNKDENNFIEFLKEPLKSNQLFIKSFTEWIEFRKQLKKPLSDITIKKQIDFLLNQPNPVDCIESSMRNGWQGLFEVKSNGNGQNKSNETLDLDK